MKQIQIFSTSIIFFALMQCENITPVEPPLPPANNCNLPAYDKYIGTKISSLESKLTGVNYRAYGPGDIVTKDLIPERINFILDTSNQAGDGKIVSINCG